ncbi:MAG: hypothetical protein D6B25_15260 [Desulfobulbaceae bacterium]|nr:MAG: hypothetical protein D6B25_15260 [Desulfobulbaceae bacterium]
MKRVIFRIMACLVVFWGTMAGATEMQTGFMSYKWGDSASSYPGLERLGEKGGVHYFSKPGEVYTIDDETIERVIYGFYQDELFGVYLNIDAIDMYDMVLNHLISKYGLPSYKGVEGGNKQVLKWKQQEVTIKLKLDKPKGKLKLAYYYRPISKVLNDSQWEELDTSSFRFVPFEKGKEREKFILFEF